MTGDEEADVGRTLNSKKRGAVMSWQFACRAAKNIAATMPKKNGTTAIVAFFLTIAFVFFSWAILISIDFHVLDFCYKTIDSLLSPTDMAVPFRYDGGISFFFKNEVINKIDFVEANA